MGIKKAGIVLAAYILVSFRLSEHSRKIPTVDKEKLWNAIVASEIVHPDIVFAQALLETGNFTSTVFKKNNNLFGMKVPRKRPTLAKKVPSTYAKYDSWEQSVMDYKLYQDYVFRKGVYSRKEYLELLDKRYCEATGYSKKLKKIIQTNKIIFL